MARNEETIRRNVPREECSPSEEACIILLGDFSAEHLDLPSLAAHFGWVIRSAADLRELEVLSGTAPVVAVLIHTRTLLTSWASAMGASRALAPTSKLVICHGASEGNAREEMLASGAYETLMLPLNKVEVQHAFGFLATQRPSQRAVVRTIARRAKRLSILRRAGAA